MRNLKKALSLALASVMVLGMTVVGSNAAFTDVDTYDHKEAIDVMQLMDVMVGDQNGNFNPDQKVTRNEMAVIIAKLMNLPLGGSHPFKDVPAWADQYVAALYAHGITGGTSATTYGGNRSITAKEAGLMLMKTLGYFTFQGEYGDDWALATVRQANKINLFKDMGVYVDQELTRNDVAQLTLNTLKSDVVVIEEQGGMNVEGNGITVNQKPHYVTNFVPETGYDYRVGGTANHLQLVEKLYGRDLKSNGNVTDAFGRPSVQWTYKTVDSVTSPKAASKVYTAPVKAKDVAADLGVAAATANFAFGADTGKYLQNGKTGGNVKVLANVNVKFGANGDVIEAYLNDDKTITVVVVSTQYGEVKKVENDGKVNRSVLIGSKTFETKNFAKGDKVLYTVADGNIQTVALLGGMKTGTVTKIVGSDLYIDGVKVDQNVACAANIESVNAGDKIDFYVDANGYIVKLNISEAVVTLDKVGFLAELNTVGGVGDKAQVRLVMADGTEKIMTVENDWTAVGVHTSASDIKDKDNNPLKNHLVSYTEKDGKFTLKLASGSRDLAATNNWKNNETVIGSGADLVKLDNNTVFVYAITEADGKVTYQVYTGYRNALSTLNDTPTFTAKVNKDNVAELVYVQANHTAIDRTNAVENWIFVVGDSKVGMTTLPDNTSYYEYKAVVNGEATTVKVSTGKTGYEFDNAYYVDKDGMTNYDLTITGYTASNAAEAASQPVQVEYKNGVVVLSKDANNDGKIDKTEETHRLNPSKDIVVVEVSADKKTVTTTTLDGLQKGLDMYSSFNWVVKDSNNQTQILVATIK